MNDETVAVLFGGRGAERAVSRKSAAAVLRAAKEAGLRTLPVFIDENGDFFLQNASGESVRAFPVRFRTPFFLTERGERYFVPTVFPVLHGDFGEDGTVQGLFASAGFSVLGADTHAGALTTDKYAAKLLARSLGIPVLDGCLFPAGTTAEEAEGTVREKLGYPVFLKPNRLGSSVGAVSVPEGGAFRSRFEDCAKYGDVLAEPCLSSPEEWEIAYLEGYRGEFFGPGRITVKDGFYDFAAKYETPGATVEDAPELPADMAEQARTFAQTLVRTIGIPHLCRVDFFRVGEKLYFNEINPLPGMTEGSMYPKLLRRAGLSFPGLVRHFAALCRDRGV